MIPLKLSSGEQEFLAEVCSLARSLKYEKETQEDYNEGMQEILNTIGQNGIMNLLDRFYWLTPQKLDSLYDRLHRTGENS